MVESGTHQQIGYILRSYPRLSQTFIVNEILALEQAGVQIQIFALTDPREEVIQPQVQQIRAPVRYLNRVPGKTAPKAWQEHAKVFRRHPAGYLRALSYALRKKEIDAGYSSSTRMECFHMAVSLTRYIDQANEKGQPAIAHLHAHFAHDPAFIAHLVHMFTGITYSFTAHARDLFQVPKTILVDRINHATSVVTCCQNNLAYLAQVAPARQPRFSMIYHGVDIHRFRPPTTAVGNLAHPLILSVGRLVEKKGYLDLIAALQRVKERGYRFHCAIYGDGPLQQQINRSIEERGLAGWVDLAGSNSQEQLLPVLQSATLFALTPAITEDGDRDGIPNVLVEAMAVGLPVITTTIAGIPELIMHNQNGLLYPPHDVDGIAAGIIQLLNDREKRERLGKAARARIVEQFDSHQSAGLLKELFSRNLLAAEYRELAQPVWPVFRS